MGGVCSDIYFIHRDASCVVQTLVVRMLVKNVGAYCSLHGR